MLRGLLTRRNSDRETKSCVLQISVQPHRIVDKERGKNLLPVGETASGMQLLYNQISIGFFSIQPQQLLVKRLNMRLRNWTGNFTGTRNGKRSMRFIGKLCIERKRTNGVESIA